MSDDLEARMLAAMAAMTEAAERQAESRQISRQAHEAVAKELLEIKAGIADLTTAIRELLVRMALFQTLLEEREKQRETLRQEALQLQQRHSQVLREFWLPFLKLLLASSGPVAALLYFLREWIVRGKK